MANLKLGSSGSGVKEWQKYLNTQGYNLKEDGIFGSNTESATKAYQKANGLTVDGIVGSQTLGKSNLVARYNPDGSIEGGEYTKLGDMAGGGKELYSNAAPPKPTFNTTSTALPPTDTTSWDDTEKGQAALGDYNSAKDAVNNYEDFTYEDYVMGETAQGAKDALDAHNANKPGEYQSQWQGQLDELMSQIMNRDKFSYDLNGDALYQQYKDNYIQQGKLAMMDTMGQAAAMTGGYGSSYAQSVGQQAYQGQLDNLNDIVPELYQMALDRYNQEGQDLYNQYGLVMDRENTDYGRYRDTVADWTNDRSYLQGVYNDERSFDYGKYIDDRNLDYTLYQDEYSKLLDALGIAQGDYYNGADMFHTEQNTKNNEAWNAYNATEDARQYANSLLQQGYQNAFDEWRANTSDSQWQQGFDREGKWRDEDIEREESWRQKEWDREGEWHEEERNDIESNRKESNANAYYQSGGKVGYDNGSLSDDQIKEMQNALGINADGKWGAGSTEAAGGLTADAAWKAYKNGTLGKSDITPDDIKGDIDYFKAQGASQSEIASYLSAALESGYITQEEYATYMEKYAPLYQTGSPGEYGGTGGGGGGSRLTVAMKN